MCGVRNESVKVFKAEVRYANLRGGTRKTCCYSFDRKEPEEDDPEKSPQKLSESVLELLSARFKNCRGVEGENKCSRRR